MNEEYEGVVKVFFINEVIGLSKIHMLNVKFYIDKICTGIFIQTNEFEDIDKGNFKETLSNLYNLRKPINEEYINNFATLLDKVDIFNLNIKPNSGELDLS